MKFIIIVTALWGLIMGFWFVVDYEFPEPKDFGPLLFQPQEKVHYIDDPNLIGRVLYRNGYGNYRVQWRAVSQHTGFLGGSVTSSPFTRRTHKAWELVSMEDKQ